MNRPSWLELQGQSKGKDEDGDNSSKGKSGLVPCQEFEAIASSSTLDRSPTASLSSISTSQRPFPPPGIIPFSWLNISSLYTAVLSFFNKRRRTRRRRTLLTRIGKPNLVSSTNAELGVIVIGGSTLGISSRLRSSQLVVKYVDVGDGTANGDGDTITKPWCYIVPRHVFGKQLSTVIEDSAEDVQTVAGSRFSRAISHVGSMKSSSLEAEV
jgi:hypothetical protein